MGLVTQIQILDKVIGISLHSYALRKGMNPPVLLTAFESLSVKIPFYKDAS